MSREYECGSCGVVWTKDEYPPEHLAGCEYENAVDMPDGMYAFEPVVDDEDLDDEDDLLDDEDLDDDEDYDEDGDYYCPDCHEPLDETGECEECDYLDDEDDFDDEAA